MRSGLITLIERSYKATTKRKLPFWWHLLWVVLGSFAAVYFLKFDTGYYLDRTEYDIVVISLFSILLLLVTFIRKNRNKRNFLWGLTGLGIGVGLLVLANFWKWQYFINPPMIFTDWSHVIIFGCEQTVSPAGEPVVLYYCPPIKLAVGNLYKIVTYPLVWFILGILIGKTKAVLES